MRHPIQLARLRTVFRSPAVQRYAADALQDISTAAIVASGYLLLFASGNDHAHRMLWVTVLAVDAVVAFLCSVDLQGGAK